MRGNLVAGQSGGPTAVVNASLAGLVDEALRHEVIEGIYGMRFGIEGLVHEDLIDLRRESAETLARLKHTPSAALGSGRYKVSEEDCQQILKVLRAHNIRFFLYIGGNGSADVALRVARFADAQDYELRVLGIPKTVDNDLVETDHCPGHPSVARWIAIAVRDAGRDTEAIGRVDSVKVIETMGRDTGWIAASSALARERDDDAPHLIYVPERPFNQQRFLGDVDRVYRQRGHVVIVIGEGVRDERGEYLAASRRSVDLDRAGRPQLGGAGAVLCELIASELGIKARFDKPGTVQRVSGVLASPVDVDEAYRVGVAAVRHAVAGRTQAMVTLVRERTAEYQSTTGLTPLERVAFATRQLPDAFVAETGTDITPAYLKYIRPLIGEALSPYARLASVPVPKRFG